MLLPQRRLNKCIFEEWKKIQSYQFNIIFSLYVKLDWKRVCFLSHEKQLDQTKYQCHNLSAYVTQVLIRVSSHAAKRKTNSLRPTCSGVQTIQLNQKLSTSVSDDAKYCFNNMTENKLIDSYVENITFEVQTMHISGYKTLPLLPNTRFGYTCYIISKNIDDDNFFRQILHVVTNVSKLV